MKRTCATIHWPLLAIKNGCVAVLLFGLWFALHHGYIVNDRVSSAAREKITHLVQHGQGVEIYREDFNGDIFAAAGELRGWKHVYNLAPEQVSIEGGQLIIRFDRPGWAGAGFYFRDYEPGAIYRVAITAVQLDKPASFTVRNAKEDQQITGIRIEPNRGKAARFEMVFEAPVSRRAGVEVWMYPYEAEDTGGVMKVLDFSLSQLVGKETP